MNSSIVLPISLDCIAYDIKPESENIIQQDWLSYKHTSSGEWVMFGNPPFGSRNILTKKFILKGIEQGCTYIGFVLPSVFEKYTSQKVFPDNWKLLGEMILPVNSFLLDGEDYHVPCVFQVWSCSEDFTQGVHFIVTLVSVATYSYLDFKPSFSMLIAAFKSLSTTNPHEHSYVLSESFKSSLIIPQLEHILLLGKYLSINLTLPPRKKDLYSSCLLSS